MARHSRENEREADKIGLDVLIKSGYDALTKPGDFELHSKLNEIGRQFDIKEEYPEFAGITPDKYMEIGFNRC